jgi:hypothetical protein
MDIFRVSDDQILQRFRSPEDNFVERKSLRDAKDILKTCVAFANTCEIEGPPGILFYPVREDGIIEDIGNPDSVQKTVRDKLSVAYPPVAYKTRVVSSNGKNVLAVIVPGSAIGPHFSGPAYVREGSSTVPASDELFPRLIDRRERKVREILKWQGQRILMRRYVMHPAPTQQRNPWAFSDARVVDCTAEWLQLDVSGPISFPLDDVKLLGRSLQPPNLLQIEVPQ